MTFDPSTYFNNRFQSLKPAKGEELQAATARKVESLKEARVAIMANTVELASEYDARERARQESLVGQLGLDPEGAVGGAINTAASLFSGATKQVGYLASLLPNVVAADAQSRLDAGDLDALQRYNEGKATGADMQRLNRSAYADAGVIDPTTDQVVTTKGETTILDLAKRMEKARNVSDAIRSGADYSGLVQQDARQGLIQDLGEGFDQKWARTKEGAQQILDGKMGEGAANLASGLGQLLMNVGAAAVNNKQAALEFIAENVPQLALGAMGKAGGTLLGASNVGYALDTYSEGIRAYQAKNGGQLPPEDLRRTMALQSAALALAEQAGDVISLKAIRGVGDAAGEAAKQTFKQSLLNIGGAAAKGTVTESLTEGVQTALEGEILGEPASAKEIFVGGAIGGIVGGGLSGGGRAASELTGATPEKMVERLKKLNEAQVKEDLVSKAIETGDVSAFADPQGKDYSPSLAVGVLFGYAQRDDVAPEQKQQALAKADEVIAEATKQLQQAEEGTAAKAQLERKVNAAISGRNQIEQLLNPASTEAKVEEAVATPSSSQDEKVVLLSMASGASLSPERAAELAEDPKSQLSDRVRQYLRVFSEARVAENLLMNLSKTSYEIYTGTATGKGKPGNVGISQYRDRLAVALRRSDQAMADDQIRGINKFAADHAAKAQAYREALDGDFKQIVRTNDGRWIPTNKTVTQTELRATGGLNVRSEKLANELEQEADALSKASGQMQLAYDLKFNPQSEASTAQPTTEVTVDASQGSTANVQNLQEGPVGEPVAQAAPASDAQAPAGTSPATGARPGSAGTGTVAGVTPQPGVDQATAPDLQDVEASGFSVESGLNTQSTEEQFSSTQQTEGTAEKAVQTQGENQSTAESTTPVQASETPAAGLGGALSTLQGDSNQQDPPGNNLAKALSTMNRAVAWVMQKAARFTDGEVSVSADRPLVSVKNFFSTWASDGPLSVDTAALVPDDLRKSPEREAKAIGALDAFARTAAQWADEIRADFIKGSLVNEAKNGRKGGQVAAEWAFRDPLQDYVSEDGQVDENMVTAISYATYAWLLDALNAPATKKKDDLKSMHGLRETDRMTDEGHGALKGVAGFRDTLTNSLGRRAVEALGLEFDPRATEEYKANVTAALGAHGMALLQRQGLVRLKEVKGDDLKRWMPTLEVANSQESRTYVEIRREDPGIAEQLQEMKVSAQGSGQALDRLFLAQRNPTYASTEPMKFVQRFAKGTQQKIPRKLRKILEKAQKTPHRVIPEMWAAMDVLGEAYLVAAGLVPENETALDKVQAGRLLSVQAQNENLRNQFELMRKMVENSPGLVDQDFFVNYEVWRNNRVGITTRDLNPQTSKIHRFSFYRPDWETKLKMDDAAQLEVFRVAVAQAIGLKIDQQPNDQTLEKFDAKLADPGFRFEELSRKLVRSINDPAGQAMSEADKQAVGEFAADAEGMQTLQAMVAWGKYVEARDAGAKDVTVHMLVGVDGKTNGPILSQLALGAGATVEELLQLLERGGIFNQASGYQNYNHWYKKASGQDLYESLAGVVLKVVDLSTKERREMFADLSVITKSLTKDGAVTSAGRKIVKTPLTAFAFGSSVPNSIESMASAFIDTVYERIEEVASGADSKVSLDMLAQALSRMLGRKVASDQLMDLVLDSNQEEKLKDFFVEVMGESVKKAMNGYFRTYIERRNAVNGAVRMAFAMYDAVYQDLRNKELERGMKEGTVRFQVITDPVTKREVRTPVHGLRIEQERALRAKAKALLPFAHTAYTEENELDAGLYMASVEQVQGKEKRFEVDVQLGRRLNDKRSFATRGMQTQEKDPGVAGLPYFMHSFDSYIMHTSLEDTQTLNVHDEAGNGVSRVTKTAQAINKAVWDGFLRGSPISSAYDMMERSILNAAAMIERGEMSNEALGAIKSAMLKQLSKEEHKNTKDLAVRILADLRAKQVAAELTRLEAMTKMTVIDQYTWEGGEYIITDADRANAQQQLDELKANQQIDQATADAVQILSDALVSGVVTPQIAAEKAFEQSLNEALDKGFPDSPIQVMQLLESAMDDLALSEGFRARLGRVFQAMAEFKLDFRDAVTSKVPPNEVGAVVEFLSRRLSEMPGDRWGERGVPRIAPDHRLVKFFETNTDVTAGRLIEGLARIFGEDSKPTSKFNLLLLKAVSRVIDKSIPVRYVTPATSQDMVLAKADKSRGWYAHSNSAKEMYFLSPEYEYSGLTPEVLLHELVHGALFPALASARKEASSSPARQVVDELEQLRIAAADRVKAEGLKQFEAGVVDIDELIAWGMTNQAFQSQVLVPLQFKSQNWGNKLVSGVKALVGAMARLLFKDADNRKMEVASNGLGVLIGNVSGLLAYAAENKAAAQNAGVQVQAMAAQVNSYTTKQVLRALDGSGLAPSFGERLESLLDGIVESLHGPFGSLKARLESSAAPTALDAWVEAKTAGAARFASRLENSDIPASEQERFVMEQVEATVRAALQDEATTSSAYKELVKLYEQARTIVTFEDFLPAEVQIQTASPQEIQAAKSAYEFMFRIEPRVMGTANQINRSEHLAKFAALALANQKVNQALQRATPAPTPVAQNLSLSQRLQKWFEKVLAFFHEKATKTYAGQQADAKLESLVNQLVEMEAKRKRMVAWRQNNETLSDRLEGMGNDTNQKIRDAAARALSAPILRNSGSAFVRAASKIGTMVAQDRLDEYMDLIAEFKDRHIKGRQGLFVGLFNAVRGPKEVFQGMLRYTKMLEKNRKQIISGTSKLVKKSFLNGGAGLTKEAKKGVTAVLLRSGSHVLLSSLGLSGIEQVISDRAQLMREIDRLEGTLQVHSTLKNFITNQANALGYFKATGEVKSPVLLMNAHNIVRMYGTNLSGRSQQGMGDMTEQQLVEITNQLIALYTIRYNSTADRQAAAQVMRVEAQRNDGNGVELAMKMHQRMEQESLERLFNSRPELMVHGYLPEVLNPHIETHIANAQEGAGLEELGFVKSHMVGKDPADPDRDAKHLYVMRDAGLEPYLSGVVSFTGKDRKGKTLHDGFLNPHVQSGQENRQVQDTVRRNRDPLITRMVNSSVRQDFSQVTASYLAPVLNEHGEVVNWRYLMKEETKDVLLDRDNSFDTLLGVMGGSIFDKQTSAEHNDDVMGALRDQFESEYATNPEAYVEISARSSDPELREIWTMMPKETRMAVKAHWGTDALMVRSDSLDILFGYRKASLAQLFTKEQRNLLEEIFVYLMEGIMGKKAAMRIRKGERVWQEIVREAKDIIVVKSGIVLAGNIWSNFSLLIAQGVPLKDIGKHHLVAMRAATSYFQDSNRLQEIKLLLDAGYSQNDKPALEREMMQLEDALARNPVRSLVDAGLMPTIVEDVAQEDDIYSYKSLLQRKIEAKTGWVNEGVMNAARTVYMTHDTPLYKSLSRVTQLSDFVARYTLYQHMTSRKINPLPHDQAVQEASDAFVNYDIPMPKLLQYTDDMGITLFTKYFLNIQRVLARMFKERPARMLGMLAMDAYAGLGPIVLEGSFLAHLGNNPINSGALKYLDVLDELATIKAATALVK